MNDILLYGAETEAEHEARVEQIRQRYVNYVLVVNVTKSEFYVHVTTFLGHSVNGREVQMHANKLKTMSTWPVHTEKKEVQGILGIANCYSRFIEK